MGCAAASMSVLQVGQRSKVKGQRKLVLIKSLLEIFSELLNLESYNVRKDESYKIFS